MTVDRSLFEKSFKDLPPWECSTCGKGHLTLSKETLRTEETGPSKQAHDHEAWDPDWIERRFVALLRCNFANCGDIVAIGGTMRLELDMEQGPSGEWNRVGVDWYEPHFVSPAPLPIRLVSGTPDEVEGALHEAAASLWHSPEAAANQVRQGVEHLLDSLKVKKLGSDKKTRLKLHDRIVALQKTDPANAEILLAIKWLGNSGSHSGGITRDHVLDAFDMVELVLTNLYSKTTMLIMKKVKAVNKAKGPAKKK